MGAGSECRDLFPSVTNTIYLMVEIPRGSINSQHIMEPRASPEHPVFWLLCFRQLSHPLYNVIGIRLKMHLPIILGK
jgi:hypothetical protein